MSNYIENKKINKKRKKKRNVMCMEDYEKEYNIKVKLSLKYEDDDEKYEPKNKSNYCIYQTNINNNKKDDIYKIESNENNTNKKELDDYIYNSSSSLNIVFHTKESASTNNSSFDENKNNVNERNLHKKSNNNNLLLNENKNIKKNNYNNYINNNKNYFYENNKINVNNNFNYNYFVNNKLNRNNFLINNIYIFNINLYKYNNMLRNNYYSYIDKMKINKININENDKQIKALEKRTLFEMFLFEQSKDLIKYINIKNKNLINNNHIDVENKNNKCEKENLEHPYFYTNHNEEIQIKNILYLIEGLFNESNLKNDFNLLIMLNRDGYASLTQLEKHPQVNKCKITENHLKTVFSEHRVNEITETVETFNNILIRNKRWVKIKKEIGDIEQVKQKSLDCTKILKENEMKKLLEKKRKFLNSLGDLYYQYHVNNCNIQQKINELKFNYNNIYNNMYNNNFNNIFNIYNNNMYNNCYNNNKNY